MKTHLKRLWRRAWRRAPRHLRVLPAGHLVIFLAIALGVGAITTNHNGLFFAWGVALGAMVISGIVSEMGLRRIQFAVSLPTGMRVGQPAQISVTLTNPARWLAAWGLETSLRLEQTDHPASQVVLSYVARLAPQQQLPLHVEFTPLRRGQVRLQAIGLQTSFPFGFFIKSRRITVPASSRWIWPRRSPVHLPPLMLLTQQGGVEARSKGCGEDFFSLRAWQQGEDMRRVVWRRLARTKRMFVVDHQAHAARELVIQIMWQTQASQQLVEHTIALVAGLVERLLASGFSVGLRSHGTWCPPRQSDGDRDRQRQTLLDALARLAPTEPLIEAPLHRHRSQLCLVGRGLQGKTSGGACIDWSLLEPSSNSFSRSEA